MENNVLRIVSWNCRNGFTSDKAKAIGFYNADILVIQECRKSDFDGVEKDWSESKFHIDEEEKSDLGVAVFSNKYKIAKDEGLNKENRYVIPYNITGAEKPFVLYVVWTKKPLKENWNYHTPVYNVLDGLLSPDKPIIFIGDFNTGSIQGASNARWYEDLSDAFARKGFINCSSKQEWVPTFFKGSNSWLDDHCFASADFQEKVISFGIGNNDYWKDYSDHCPIIVDFTL
jgi:exonuclease III